MAINIERVVENCEFAYFMVPTLQEPLTARALGNAVLWSFVNECVDRSKRGVAKRNVVIAIEEFQQIVGGKVIEDVLTLGRKFGCQFILSNQTSSQLKLKDVDLRPIVKDNTSIQVHFTLPTEEDRQAILDHSKTVTRLRKSSTAKGLGSSITMQEVEQPGFDGNLCRDISGTFGHAVMVESLGQGHSDPIHLVCEPLVPKEEHERLSNTPLPKRANTPSVVPKKRARKVASIPEVERVQRHAALMAIVEEKRRLRNEWRTQIPPRSNS